MAKMKTSDGVEHNYDVYGSGEVGVVFMPGWAGTGAYFKETLEAMDGSTAKYVTYDMRGHGDSEKTEEGFTHERLAKDLIEVANTAGLDKFFVVGYSMSRRFAQMVPIVAPEKVRGLVLVAGAPTFEIPIPKESYDSFCSCANNRDLMKEMINGFLQIHPPDAVKDRFLDGAVKASAFALRKTLDLYMQESFADKVGAIKCPTLVVAGAEDQMFAADMLKQTVLPSLSRSRMILMPCNHEIPMEMPSELGRVIDAFIAGVPERILARHPRGDPQRRPPPRFRRRSPDQARSKRSRFMTLSHAATKSRTNVCCESSHA